MQSVTNHLMRSGTLWEHICRAIVETAECERDEDLEATLTEMARTARNIFNEGLDWTCPGSVDTLPSRSVLFSQPNLLELSRA